MINKDMSITELLQAYPQTADILREVGMACSLCMGASTETLEQGIKAHGLKLEEVLSQLNSIIKENNGV
ncbi:MAG: disulfide oxidoreductase [Clostridiaceae bacterium BRH_c20a]|nr:MAG: disulfide oxidoreductase [Clostridiaceae bacterium BRH_c20a]